MLKSKQSALLARVKLHQRPLRLAVPLIFFALLFGAVFLGLSAIAFLEGQVNTLARSGMNGRHIVSVGVSIYNESIRNNPRIQVRAEELYNEAIKHNTALAKQFGVHYDPETEEAPFEVVWGEREFRYWTRYAQLAIAEWYSQNTVTADIDDLKRIASPYGGFNIITGYSLMPRGSFNALSDGKENLRRITHPWTDWQSEPLPFVNVVGSTITRDFELDGAEQLDISGKIPVILTYRIMAAQFDLDDPESESDLNKKSELMQQIREQSLGHEIQVCFRNSVSQARIMSAMEAGLANQKPRLEWGLPTEPCGASPIVADRRTASEKDYDRRLQEFQFATGAITETEAVEEVFTFIIIGLTEEGIWGEPTTIVEMIQKLSRQAIGAPVTPSYFYDRIDPAIRGKMDQAFSNHNIDEWASTGLPLVSYAVEFPDRETADRFIEENTCLQTNTGCSTEERPFAMAHLNPNAALLDQIVTQTSNASRLLMLVGTGLVVLFALIIIILLLINDRREIAIFRAIGYKRSEIMQIYLAFAAILATIIIVGALVIGSVAGLVLNLVFYDTISITLRTIFSAPDANVILPIWNWVVVGQIVLIGYGAVLVGGIVPIFLNSRASIISAIRAE